MSPSRTFACALLLFAAARAGRAANEPAPLPPLLPWDGQSRELAADAGDPWITPCEESGLTRTPSYDETVAWLARLAAAAPEVEMTSIGRSHEGRDVWLVIASADRAFTPRALKAAGKPTLFVQAGIHSGEIDGKDAGMMLLRDLTTRGTRRELLAGANLLFLPILNVDGHERSSRTNRINQRGPELQGWRTNARNLNLNRDYAKLDAPEVRGLVAALDQWDPDLYLDVHVTDGIDYQYDVTTGFTGDHGWSPCCAAWLRDVLTPACWRELEAWGHVPGPLVFARDEADLGQGIVDWTPTPRFSNGYGDARHLPTLLVENHSLKPFAQRVLGTRVLLESCMRVLAEQGGALRAAISKDRRRPQRVPLAWRVPQGEAEKIAFKGIAARVVASEVTGSSIVEWLGQPIEATIPWQRMTEPVEWVAPPAAYWIPPSWPEVIERLALHGVEMQVIHEPRELEVEMYRLSGSKLGEVPYEGHVTVTSSAAVERRRQVFPPGSARVATDQPLGVLAVLLLEPASRDSFFQWGFFLEVLQRAEYFEAYALEPLARRMLAEDAALAAEFQKKLAGDPEFASDPRRRLEFFYERSPYRDERWNLYPVAREL